MVVFGSVRYTLTQRTVGQSVMWDAVGAVGAVGAAVVSAVDVASWVLYERSE